MLTPDVCLWPHAGADNGSLWFWDWTSGNAFQQQDTIVQPGSLDSEAGACLCIEHDAGTCMLQTSRCGRAEAGQLQAAGRALGVHSSLWLPPCVLQAFMRCPLMSPSGFHLCPAGIYAMSFDVTGSRLVTCEADKTIKMWKEDETATEASHPIQFVPPRDIKRF